MTTDEEEALLAEIRSDHERLNSHDSPSKVFTAAEMGLVLKRLDQKEKAREMWEKLYRRADDESIQLRTILVSAVPDQRPESGPMCFGEDWPGLFLRGDHCFAFADALRALIGAQPENDRPLYMSLEGLCELMESTRMRMEGSTGFHEPEGTQHAVLVEPLDMEASDRAKTLQELLRTVVTWMNNSNPGAPEIIEAAGEWMEVGCPGLMKAAVKAGDEEG